ncbi:MAG: hypothetical protein KAT62_00750 [Desulfuromonadales bacterium]|nr:hypothetical protein [Desulfuromonadales bacterium]
MTLREQMQSDLDAIYTSDEFAELIMLAGATVTAIIGIPEETSEQSIAVRNVALTLSVRVSEVPVVNRGAVAVIGGATYRVLGDPLNDGLEWNLDLAQEMVTL